MKLFKCSVMVGLLLASLTSQAVLQVPPPKNVAKAPSNSVKLEPGIHYIVLNGSMGRLAQKQYVKSNSTGWTSADGKTQFSAEEDGYDVSDPNSLVPVTPGLAKAVKATPLGEKRRWWIAANKMQPGWTDMAQGAYTVDIEVLEEMDPLPAPADLLNPPATAKSTSSGLKYVVLAKGKTTRKPKDTDKVTVHYSGWTADGNMFDSSVLRNKALEFQLNRVIRGWREGMRLMTVGDTFRFWIPVQLAYGDNPRGGAPHGDLVFDVELLLINN